MIHPHPKYRYDACPNCGGVFGEDARRIVGAQIPPGTESINCAVGHCVGCLHVIACYMTPDRRHIEITTPDYDWLHTFISETDRAEILESIEREFIKRNQWG